MALENLNRVTSAPSVLAGWAVFLLAICSSELRADDILTLSGKKYESIAVKRKDPDGLVILHRGGTSKVYFADMSDAMRVRYGFDPVAYANFEKEVRENEGRLAKLAEAAAIAERVKIQEMQAQQAKELADLELERRTVRLEGQVLQITEAGILVQCRTAIPSSSGLGSLGGGASVPASSEGRSPYERVKDGLYLLIGHPQQGSLVDQDIVDVLALEEGIFSYKSTLGAIKTVRSYRVRTK